VQTSPTEKEIRANALRYARNTWRRFTTYEVRFKKKYTTGPTPTPAAFFDNRILEDSFAKTWQIRSCYSVRNSKIRPDLMRSLLLALPDVCRVTKSLLARR
jgi:hypothetical protein